MPHDLGTWGFIIALAALILAYPLDVLAHVTSPILRDWWAARSIAALQKRFDVLSARLDQLRDVQVIDEVAEQLFVAQERTMLMIGFGVHNLLTGLVLITSTMAPDFLFEIGGLAFLIITNLFLMFGFRRNTTTYLARVSPNRRDGLKADVAKIEKALQERRQVTFQKG